LRFGIEEKEFINRTFLEVEAGVDIQEIRGLLDEEDVSDLKDQQFRRSIVPS